MARETRTSCRVADGGSCRSQGPRPGAPRRRPRRGARPEPDRHPQPCYQFTSLQQRSLAPVLAFGVGVERAHAAGSEVEDPDSVQLGFPDMRGPGGEEPSAGIQAADTDGNMSLAGLLQLVDRGRRAIERHHEDLAEDVPCRDHEASPGIHLLEAKGSFIRPAWPRRHELAHLLASAEDSGQRRSTPASEVEMRRPSRVKVTPTCGGSCRPSTIECGPAVFHRIAVLPCSEASHVPSGLNRILVTISDSLKRGAGSAVRGATRLNRNIERRGRDVNPGAVARNRPRGSNAIWRASAGLLSVRSRRAEGASQMRTSPEVWPVTALSRHGRIQMTRPSSVPNTRGGAERASSRCWRRRPRCSDPIHVPVGSMAQSTRPCGSQRPRSSWVVPSRERRRTRAGCSPSAH